MNPFNCRFFQAYEEFAHITQIDNNEEVYQLIKICIEYEKQLKYDHPIPLLLKLDQPTILKLWSPVLDFIAKNVNKKIDFQLFRLVCKECNPEVIQWFYKKFPELSYDCIKNFKQEKFLDVLHNLFKKGLIQLIKNMMSQSLESVYIKDIVFINACTYGHLDIIQWLKNNHIDNSSKWPLDFLQIMCQKGNVSILQLYMDQWSHHFRYNNIAFQIFHTACCNTCAHFLFDQFDYIKQQCIKEFNIFHRDYFSYQHYKLGRQNIVFVIIKHNLIPFLKYILQSCSISIESKVALFIKFCSDGNLNMAQWLNDKWPQIRQEKNAELAFKKACQKNHLHIIKWLYTNNWPLCSIDLQELCEKGHLIMIQWLIENCLNILPSYISHEFSIICQKGYLQMAQLFIKTWPSDKNYKYLDYTFQQVCKNGNLSMAQWMKIQFPKINPTSDSYKAFSLACKYGHLQVAQWLHDQWPYCERFINPIDQIFSDTCANGHLSTAKWIFQTWPNIDKYDAFYYVYLKGHYDLAKWFIKTLKLKPVLCIKDIYQEIYNKHYNIRTLFIENWPDIF